jgi:hypothetical protein
VAQPTSASARASVSRSSVAHVSIILWIQEERVHARATSRDQAPTAMTVRGVGACARTPASRSTQPESFVAALVADAWSALANGVLWAMRSRLLGVGGVML